MIQPTCPSCRGDKAIWLETISRDAMVNYYRCPCGHVWNVTKDPPYRQQDVTARPALRQQNRD